METLLITLGIFFALLALGLLYLDFFHWEAIRFMGESVRSLQWMSDGQLRAFAIFSHLGALAAGTGFVVGLTGSL